MITNINKHDFFFMYLLFCFKRPLVNDISSCHMKHVNFYNAAAYLKY